jgi:uncharacterized membrane-anchored protein YjiN (DUF445 family)
MKTWIKIKRRKLRAKKRQLKDSLREKVVKMLGLTREDIMEILEEDFPMSDAFDKLIDETTDRVAQNVSISEIGDYIAQDIQEYIETDYSAIADNLCLSSLASEIDASEIAEHIDIDDVAMYIDNEALAVYVVQKIGELLASKANSIV